MAQPYANGLRWGSQPRAGLVSQLDKEQAARDFSSPVAVSPRRQTRVSTSSGDLRRNLFLWRRSRSRLILPTRADKGGSERSFPALDGGRSRYGEALVALADRIETMSEGWGAQREKGNESAEDY